MFVNNREMFYCEVADPCVILSVSAEMDMMKRR